MHTPRGESRRRNQPDREQRKGHERDDGSPRYHFVADDHRDLEKHEHPEHPKRREECEFEAAITAAGPHDGSIPRSTR